MPSERGERAALGPNGEHWTLAEFCRSQGLPEDTPPEMVLQHVLGNKGMTIAMLHLIENQLRAEVEQCYTIIRTANLMVQADATDAPGRISTAIRPYLGAVVSCLDEFGMTKVATSTDVGPDT